MLYNHAGNNVNDFIATEIIDGRLRFSYRIEDINNNRYSRVFHFFTIFEIKNAQGAIGWGFGKKSRGQNFFGL